MRSMIAGVQSLLQTLRDTNPAIADPSGEAAALRERVGGLAARFRAG